MFQFFALLLFGWLAILASLFFGVLGIVRKMPLWILIGGLLVIPHAYYLSGTPLIGSAGFLLPVAYGGAAVSVRYRVRWLAWLLLLPQVILDTWLAYSVLNQ